MSRIAPILVLVMSGVLFAQTDTNDPTDTPTVRALTALLPLCDQALHGEWLRDQAGEAQFAEWLSRQNESSEFALWVAAQSDQSAFAGWLVAQQQDAGKAVFASYLGQPEVLLGVRSTYARPNYGGNAFEAVRRNLWLQFARGEALSR